jgi:serine/threonine-protein kinase
MSPLLLVVLFIATVIVVVLAFQGGLLFGRWRSRQPDPEPVLPVRTLVASILSLLARKHRLDEEVAVRLARGAAGALGALHEKGIISGGLSPETLRVASGGDAPSKLLLTPFGLVSPRQIEALLPPGRGVEGDRSLDYISPEQGAGATPDARSDLYSLALILLEMLAGETVLLEHLGARGATPPGAPPLVPVPALGGGWSEFFRRALARNPDERFQTAEEFAAALPGRREG